MPDNRVTVQNLENQKSNLIKELQLVQEKEEYISNKDVSAIAQYSSIPIVDIEFE